MPFSLIPINEGRPIVLDKAIVLIGRHPDCDAVVTRSRKISRKHCCIAQVNDKLVVRDLGSMNGVRVNGKRVRRQAFIEKGDELAVGDVRYILELQGRTEKKAPNENLAEVGSASPAEISQDVPVIIPDEERSFSVEPSLNAAGAQLSANEPPIPHRGIDDQIEDVEVIDEVPLDDVIPLSESNEFPELK